MNKKIYRLLSISVAFILVLGNSYIADALSARAAPMPQNQVATPLAFPGAEGFGANTIGGRGGAIFEVTNLNDSGAGSLRACVEASGARTCVFRTGGLITLNSPLTIRNPFITIAGQTAPGGGITIRTATGGDVFSTKTHDVIMRYVTARPGPGGENHANQIALNGVALYNIMIDHSTFSWGVDSNIETWYRVYNTSIQWSIISEALDCSTHSKGCHSKGIMIGGYAGSESGTTKGSEDISVHHNLIAHVGERAPLMQVCGTAQIVNNVTYNPYWTFAHQQNNCPGYISYVNWVGNYHKKGPDSTSNSDLKVIPADSGDPPGGGAKVYVQGNIGPSRTDDSQPESNWVDSGSRSYIVAAPASAPAITTTNALTAYNNVLADAGNNAGVSCNGTWYNRRDAIDTRIVNDVKNGTGHIIDDPSQVGGWIVPAVGVPCTDGDHDGMPDAWEQLYGFNLSVPDGSGDMDGDGYTNVEEYFNGTNPLDSIPPTTPPATTPTATPVISPTATPITIFADVPSTYWAYSWINTVYRNGITGGCGNAPLIFCPERPVTRAEMAVFLERGIQGSGYTPPDVTTQFGDTANNWAQDWIDALADDGITSGCGGGNYCPDGAVTRAQMAVFLLRAMHGATYTPPAASGTMFGDVSASHWAAAWIEQLAVEGITAGCNGQDYCPESSVTRAQMAIFLVKAFNLQ